MLSSILALALATLPPTLAPRLSIATTFDQSPLHSVTHERSSQTVLIASAVLLLALEIAILHERDSGHHVPTISQEMTEWGDKYGLVPWTFGALGGHWFWSGEPVSPRVARANAMTLVWSTLAVGAWDVLDHSGHDKRRAPMLAIGGFFAGHFLWAAR